MSGPRPHRDAPPQLRLTCRQVGEDVLVIGVVGEIDLSTAPQLRTYLVEKTASRPAHLVLDLSEVGFLASHGVSLLLDAREGRGGIHGRLHLLGVAPHRPVARVLDVTGLTPLFDVHDDEDALLRTLRRG